MNMKWRLALIGLTRAGKVCVRPFIGTEARVAQDNSGRAYAGISILERVGSGQAADLLVTDGKKEDSRGEGERGVR